KPRKSPRTLHTDRARSRSLKRRVFAWALRPCCFRFIGRICLRPLTVKLSGRVSAPRALQSVFIRKARSAPTYPSLHGPLERWLERTHRPSTVRAPRESGKPQRTSRRVKRAAEP